MFNNIAAILKSIYRQEIVFNLTAKKVITTIDSDNIINLWLFLCKLNINNNNTAIMKLIENDKLNKR